MNKTILFIDGPKAGERYTVNKEPTDTIYVALPESIADIFTMSNPTAITMPAFRKGVYRACRIQSTGHIVHNQEQEMLFQYQGEC